MDGGSYENYFVQPEDATQLRYEVVRAIIVDGELCVDVAHRMNVPHGTVRNWVCEFRKQIDAGCAPPFLFKHLRAGRPGGAH
jgi:transposase